jgi:hypothetical protein
VAASPLAERARQRSRRDWRGIDKSDMVGSRSGRPPPRDAMINAYPIALN